MMIRKHQEMIDRLIALAEFADLELAIEARAMFPQPTDDFEPAWALYERHGNKVQAQKAWRRLSQEDKEACITVIPAYIAAKPEERFRMHFSTYLNNRAWEDKLPTVTAPKGTLQPGIAPEQKPSWK